MSRAQRRGTPRFQNGDGRASGGRTGKKHGGRAMEQREDTGGRTQAAATPDLSLEDLLAVLRIYNDTARKRVDTFPDDGPALLMHRLTRNAIVYLAAYQGSLNAMERFQDQLSALRLRHMGTEAPPQ